MNALPPEARARLDAFLALLAKWQRAINLTSRKAGEGGLDAQVEDCLRALPLLPDKAVRLADVGSGNGFPGLVLAACGYRVTLFESDQRKAAFLAEALRVMGVSGVVRAERVETYTGDPFDVITARGFADVAKTLALTASLRAPHTRLLTWKRAPVPDEIAAARARHRFTLHEHPHPGGLLLELAGIGQG